MRAQIQENYRQIFLIFLISLLIFTTYNVGISQSAIRQSDPYQTKDLLISVSGDADSNVWTYMYTKILQD